MKIVQNKSNKVIALEMGISYQTVKNHINMIYLKTGCDTRVAVALKYCYLINPGYSI